MPAYELAFPVGAYNLKIKKDTYEYPVLAGTDTFTRTGLDGAEIILPLNGGDEFIGEVLEGQWLPKGWDANISTFIALITGGDLNLGGVAAVAGTAGNGWVNGNNPVVLMDEAELTFEMEVPVSDTGAAADRDIYFDFLLTKNKMTAQPSTDTDLVLFEVYVDENGLLLNIVKRVDSAWTTIFDGSTYDDASVIDPAANRFVIWRVVFHEADEDNDYRHMHVYLKQAASRADAETADENELSTSPYDISDWRFTVAYPAWLIYTMNATYFGSGNRAASDYLRVSYPDYERRYDVAAAGIHYGECECYDTMGSATETDWQRIRG
jgi:hypothetical protein